MFFLITKISLCVFRNIFVTSLSNLLYTTTFCLCEYTTKFKSEKYHLYFMLIRKYFTPPKWTICAFQRNTSKFAIFWSISLESKIERKTLILEMWFLNKLDDLRFSLSKNVYDCLSTFNKSMRTFLLLIARYVELVTYI